MTKVPLTIYVEESARDALRDKVGRNNISEWIWKKLKREFKLQESYESETNPVKRRNLESENEKLKRKIKELEEVANRDTFQKN